MKGAMYRADVLGIRECEPSGKAFYSQLRVSLPLWAIRWSGRAAWVVGSCAATRKDPCDTDRRFHPMPPAVRRSGWFHALPRPWGRRVPTPFVFDPKALS